MMQAWYAVYTRFQHEKSAAKLLESKEFEVLLPVYQAVHRWKDRNKTVTLPLFPCYLFLRTDLDRKTEVLKTPGVRWLVENCGCAEPVSEAEIETIRRVSSFPSGTLPHPLLRQGQSVRIRRGPLAGNEGILTRIKNQYRVVISVELVQRAVSVEVHLADVEPLHVLRARAQRFHVAAANAQASGPHSQN